MSTAGRAVADEPAPRDGRRGRWAVVAGRSEWRTVSQAATPIAARRAMRSSGRRSKRIERKVLVGRDVARVPRRRRDHRGVVGAERRAAPRRPSGSDATELRVGRHAADDRDAVAARWPRSARRARARSRAGSSRRGRRGAPRARPARARARRRAAPSSAPRTRSRAPARARPGSRRPRGRRSRASRSISAPPGYGSPSRRAPLSKASPAASSSVVPSTVTPSHARSRTSRRSVCPPLASRQVKGGSRSSGSRKSEATWPCRWFTGTSGSPRPHASPLAAETPTSSAPISPGPAVTATVSTSSSVVCASSRASRITGEISSRCRRDGDLRHDAAELACSSACETRRCLGEDLPVVA